MFSLYSNRHLRQDVPFHLLLTHCTMIRDEECPELTDYAPLKPVQELLKVPNQNGVHASVRLRKGVIAFQIIKFNLYEAGREKH